MRLIEGSARRQPIIALLLAGRIRPSPMLEALDLHELCLPVGLQGRLIDAWLATLAELEGVFDVRVVVNTAAEVASINSSLQGDLDDEYTFDVATMTEPAAWRGAGGIVRDVMDVAGHDDSSLVLICEAKKLPPPSLKPIVARFHSDGGATGVVGICGRDEPAGVYLFEQSSLTCIPSVGYFDFKEQFLPTLVRNRARLLSAHLSGSVHRLSDLDGYLRTVRQSLSAGASKSAIRISPHASVSGSAVLTGHCIVEAGAVIEDGAIVHDSVILQGATVGGGSVVCRSVLGPLTSVAPRSRVLKSLLTLPSDAPSRSQPVDRLNRLMPIRSNGAGRLEAREGVSES